MFRAQRETRHSTAGKTEDRISSRFLVPFALVVALHVAGMLSPSRSTWGFDYWSLVDLRISLAVLALGLALLALPVSHRLSQRCGSVYRVLSSLLGRFNRGVLAVIGMFITFSVLFAFRSRALFYGDGLTILNSVSDPGGMVIHDQHYLQLGALYFHHYIFLVTVKLVDASPEIVFAATNVAGGIVGLWAICRMSTMLSRDDATRWFIVIGTLSSASLVLFFGYVENYTWATALGLWALCFCIGYVQNKNGRLPVLVSAIIASAFHMIAVPYLVVAFLAVFSSRKRRQSLTFGIPFGWVSVLVVVGSGVLVALVQLSSLPQVFVPIWLGGEGAYLAFGLEHLKDVVNEAVLVAPLGCAVLLVVPFLRKRTSHAIGPEERILIATSLLAFLSAFWIDPKLGAVRDWDLLALFGFPLSLWGVYRLTRCFPGNKVAPVWLIPALVVGLIHVIPNLVEKNDPDTALARLDRILWDDLHYQADHERAYRGLSWGFILYVNLGRDDLAEKYFKRRLSVEERSYQSAINLGDIYYRRGKYDMAVSYLSQGLKGRPDEGKALCMLSDAELRIGRLSDALEHARQAVQLLPGDVVAVTTLGIALSKMQNHADALFSFRKAYDLAPGTFKNIFNLGVAHGAVGNLDSAAYYLNVALLRASTSEKPAAYCALVSTVLKMGMIDEASSLFAGFKREFPSHPEIHRLAEEIRRASHRQ